MHNEYTMLMSAELDGEAAPAEIQRLRDHLRTCASCAAIWQQWRVVDRRLDAVTLLAAPGDFTERVMSRLDEAELRRRRARWVGSGLALGLLSLLLVVVFWAILTIPWLQGNTPQIARLGAVVVQLGDALLLLARGVMTAIAGLGAPILAATAGLIACATCALGATWLKLLSQRGYLYGPAVQVAS